MSSTNPQEWAVKYEPRRWQEEALQRWKAQGRGVVKIATGGGKTVFSFFCVSHFLKSAENPAILVIVPTTALLDQWFVSFTEEFGVPEDVISCYSGEEKPGSPTTVNILVINTARSKAPLLAEQLGSTFLIVDECHRAGSPENAKALRGDHTATLGLSATPERQQDEGFETHIRPSLGPIIYSYNYTDARDDEVIAPFDLINVRVNLLPPEQKKYDSLTKKLAILGRKYDFGEISEDRFNAVARKRAAVSNNAVLRVPVAAKIVDSHKGSRCLVFHESIEAADRIAEILDSRSHRVAVYHSGVGPALRRSNLQLYRQGTFDVLVTCRALDEGMNVPETEVAVVASSTSSERQRIQRLGRVLRPSPGKDRALIYTLFATDTEKEQLREESEELADVTHASWMKSSN